MLNISSKIPLKIVMLLSGWQFQSGADAKMGSGNLSVLTNELG
jgi:hypothetical protein